MVFAITSVVRGYHAYKDIWDAEIDSAFRLRSSSATYLDFHVLIELSLNSVDSNVESLLGFHEIKRISLPVLAAPQ